MTDPSTGQTARMTLMWEARAADGRLDELVAHVLAASDRDALVFRSSDRDPRVVVIDPSGRGVDDIPRELVARPPHAWPFEPVPRVAHTPAYGESASVSERSERTMGVELGRSGERSERSRE